MSTSQWFSAQSADYAKYRPTYPKALFDCIAKKAKHHNAAWDCGTGNGQAAVDLAEHFKKVYATDGSENQILHPISHPNVQYSVADAAHSGLAEHSIDVVTVAQALHWFATPEFFNEVRRVSTTDGILVAWCYSLCSIEDATWDQALKNFYYHIQEYFPPGREHIDAKYETIPFPLTHVETIVFPQTYQWEPAGMMAYLNTWSAIQRYLAKHHQHPFKTEFGKPLVALAESTKAPLNVTFNMITKMGQIH